MGDGTAARARTSGQVAAAQTATFLDTLAATGNVRAAARAAAVSFTTFYNRRRIDRDFAAAWEAAKAVAYERVEAAAQSQAIARLAA